MRLVCRPAARATATGAAESHSYCPPACTYAAATSRTTAITLAPAEPIGTSSAPSSSARGATKAGGGRGEPRPGGRGEDGGGPGGGVRVRRGGRGRGGAPAPATSSPSPSVPAHSATCTAQSSRGGSE